MKLPLSVIVCAPKAQPRATLDKETITEYAEAMARGDQFPPIVAFGTGASAYVADGWHRVRAAEQVGADAIDVDLRPGGLEDAVWFSCGANATHGLRRSREDIQRAIDAALSARPNLSDREIAVYVGATHPTVAVARERLVATGKIYQSPERRGADGRTINTANIGRPSSVPKPQGARPALLSPAADVEPEAGGGLCFECRNPIPADADACPACEVKPIHASPRSPTERYPELNAPGIPEREAGIIAATLDSMEPGTRDEKRAALRRQQPGILAELAGLPPLPPSERPQKSAGQRWVDALTKAHGVLRSPEFSGGVAALTTTWTPDEKQTALWVVERIGTLTREWQEDLRKEVGHGADVA